MEQDRIIFEMYELEKLIEYKFDNIQHLADAMYTRKIGTSKNSNEHSNDALATVGDAVLKAILAEEIFQKDVKKTRGNITIEKSLLENNDVLFEVANKTKIYDFAYHDKYFAKDNPPGHLLVANSSNHPTYIEAIIGSIFHDSNFEKTRDWVIKWLLPKAENLKVAIN